MICPKCGFNNIENAQFCMECGTKLLGVNIPNENFDDGTRRSKDINFYGNNPEEYEKIKKFGFFSYLIPGLNHIRLGRKKEGRQLLFVSIIFLFVLPPVYFIIALLAYIEIKMNKKILFK